MPVLLKADPVAPERLKASLRAPELARLTALPVADAFAVLGEEPESPEPVGGPAPLMGMNTLVPGTTVTPPGWVGPKMLAIPRMPVLREKGLLVASPAVPGVPEVPEVDAGFDVAVEVASPVSPELVALDCPPASPLSPEAALGPAITAASPPSPPLASLMVTVFPTISTTVVALQDRCRRRRLRRLRRSPRWCSRRRRCRRRHCCPGSNAPELASLLEMPEDEAPSITCSVSGGAECLVGLGDGRPRPRWTTRMVTIPAPTRALADLTRAVPAEPILMAFPCGKSRWGVAGRARSRGGRGVEEGCAGRERSRAARPGALGGTGGPRGALAMDLGPAHPVQNPLLPERCCGGRLTPPKWVPVYHGGTSVTRMMKRRENGADLRFCLLEGVGAGPGGGPRRDQPGGARNPALNASNTGCSRSQSAWPGLEVEGEAVGPGDEAEVDRPLPAVGELPDGGREAGIGRGLDAYALVAGVLGREPGLEVAATRPRVTAPAAARGRPAGRRRTTGRGSR